MSNPEEECTNEKCEEYRQVAALVCIDLDVLGEAIKDMDNLESVKAMVLHTIKQKETVINDPKIRKMRFDASSWIFSLAINSGEEK